MIPSKTDDDLTNECGFLKIDFNRLCLEFKKLLTEQNEEYIDCNKLED